MNLDIFERIHNGGHVRIDYPALSVGKKVLYFNVACGNEFKFIKDQLVILSIDREFNKWYVCFLPELSTKRAYRLSRTSIKGNGFLMANSNRYIENGLEIGYYRFSEPEFDGELDWYELIKININDL